MLAQIQPLACMVKNYLATIATTILNVLRDVAHETKTLALISVLASISVSPTQIAQRPLIVVAWATVPNRACAHLHLKNSGTRVIWTTNATQR
jgi:hypothetical protein